MFEEPSFLLQVGHNGRNRVELAIENDHLDGAILSPSDYEMDDSRGIADDLSAADYLTLFDPQFYLPGQGDRDDLNDYDYHNEYGGEDYTSGFFYDSDNRREFCDSVISTEEELDVDAYISPSPFIERINDDAIDNWYDLSESFLESAKAVDDTKPVFLSLPVDGGQINDVDRRNSLLNTITELDVDGFYVSVAHDGDVRVPLRGEENIISYLDLMLSLRTNRYEVIAAHTHQVSHLLFAIGVNAIASGHYKNLRSLDIDRWIVPDETQIRRTVIRYYSDALLQSIRPDSLLNELYDNQSFDESSVRTGSPYDAGLFDSGTSPANAGWGMASGSWEHYNWSCHEIAKRYRNMSLGERMTAAQERISSARDLYTQIDSEIDGGTTEIEGDLYSEWESSLRSVAETPEFKRMKRMI